MAQYFSPQEINRIVAETEAEIDAREAQRAEQQRMQQITAWINDPKNKAAIDNDPMVKKLRAMGSPAPLSPRTAPQPVQHTVAPAPMPYKSRQQLEKERPWLAPRKPELESVIDPYCGRRQDRIRIG
jgi:hypothetical protein